MCVHIVCSRNKGECQLVTKVGDGRGWFGST